MNFRSKFYKPALGLLAVLLLCGSSAMQKVLNADREKFGFTRLAPLQNAPPMLAFTSVALGGFRGLISNFLWIRASQLQEDEKYFEMVQLSDWITTLEPHFPEVWTEQAWNMAYNISVKCKNFEERWKWVQRGIHLLYKGLQYNPGDVSMYKELAWIFRHKMGQNLDDAHMVYKFHWAQEMEGIFVGGRPDFDALLNPKTPEDREKVRKLREDYHMDPAMIQEVDKQFGPLDWRMADTTGLYWTVMGIRNGTDEDKQLIRRFRYQIMQDICLGQSALPPGVTNVTHANFILWPNLNMVTNVNAAFEETAEQATNVLTSVRTAQKNFLKDAVVLLYEYNRTRDASHWFNYLKQNFTNAFTPAEADLSLENYVLRQVETTAGEEDPKRTTALILGLISQEYQNLFADQDDEARNLDDMAQAIWKNYTKRLPTNGNGDNSRRIALEPYEKLRRLELETLPPQAAAIIRAKLGIPPPANNPPTGGVGT